jgi:hypothetical protein
MQHKKIAKNNKAENKSQKSIGFSTHAFCFKQNHRLSK